MLATSYYAMKAAFDGYVTLSQVVVTSYYAKKYALGVNYIVSSRSYVILCQEKRFGGLRCHVK